MCKLKSVIILKDRVYCPLDHDSHDQMLKELGIDDTRENAERLFVRAELSPKKHENLKDDPATWDYNVDQDILPEWYVKEIDKQRVIDAVTEWKEKRVIIDGEVNAKGKERFYLYGSSTAELHGSSKAELYESSKATLYGSSTATLHGSSTAWLYGSSTAELHDSSTAKLRDSSTAKLHGSSTATLYDSSKATLYGSSKAELYDSSTGIIPLYSYNFLSSIRISDRAVAISHKESKIATADKVFDF